MNGKRTVALACVLAVMLVVAGGHFQPAAPQPEGEMRWALYVTLSPVWFDPGEVLGLITPFWVMYAIHDAVVKPMPGNLMAPSLAESWTPSADQRVYEFKLHQIQQILHERVRFGPIWEYIWPSGIGPRVEQPALMLIDPYPWSAPLEEVRLKKAGR